MSNTNSNTAATNSVSFKHWAPVRLLCLLPDYTQTVFSIPLEYRQDDFGYPFLRATLPKDSGYEVVFDLGKVCGTLMALYTKEMYHCGSTEQFFFRDRVPFKESPVGFPVERYVVFFTNALRQLLCNDDETNSLPVDQIVLYLIDNDSCEPANTAPAKVYFCALTSDKVALQGGREILVDLLSKNPVAAPQPLHYKKIELYSRIGLTYTQIALPVYKRFVQDEPLVFAPAIQSDLSVTDATNIRSGSIAEQPPAKQVRDSEEEPFRCMICFDGVPSTTVYPCGHVVVCKACSDRLRNTNDHHTCVRCRCPITRIDEH